MLAAQHSPISHTTLGDPPPLRTMAAVTAAARLGARAQPPTSACWLVLPLLPIHKLQCAKR